MPSASLTAARGYIDQAVDLAHTTYLTREATVESLPEGDTKEAAKVPRDFMSAISVALVRAQTKAALIS